MDLGLKNKSVLVMASSKGLGKATAMEFARAGARVVISSRNATELEKTTAEIKETTGNQSVDFKVCDVMDPEAIKSLVKFVATKNDTIDVLVNNSGGPPAGNFDAFDDHAWQNAFELTLLSYIRTIREVLPYMRQQKRGHIVNFASSSTKQPIENLTLSNVFRVGVTGLSKTLALELGPDNILVNTVSPGRIATDRIDELNQIEADKLGVSKEEVLKRHESQTALGRLGEPEEFARAVTFLCSGANSYVTGQSIIIDGGLVKAI